MSGLLDVADRFVTAPTHGCFRPRRPDVVTSEGEWVEAGQVLGTIESSRGDIAVLASWSGWLMAYLVAEGERVRPGTELVHLVEA